MNGLMGGFYKISEWIMRLSAINLLWMICSLPFFFFLLIAFYPPFVLIAAPLTLAPATAAMFTVARKWVMGDVDVPLFKSFFRGYKENFVQSLLGGIIFEIIAAVMYVNYHFYGTQTGSMKILSVLFIVFTVLLAAAFFNFISIMVHFHMKLIQVVKNAILITIGRPIGSVVMLVANGAILYISFYKFTFLIPFFMGSLIAVVSFWNFYRGFERMQAKFAAKEDADEDGDATEEDDAAPKAIEEFGAASASSESVPDDRRRDV